MRRRRRPLPVLPVAFLGLALAGCGTLTAPSPAGPHPVAGKTYVVTGASSGFGRGVALELGGRGANVVLAARRTAVLWEVAAEVRDAGGRALVVTTDVSRPAEVERLAAAAVDRFGAIDVWINNAGVTAIGRFEEIPARDHARLVDVNLKGTIYGSRAAMRQFRRQGHGTLVNVSSVAAELPLPYQASYAATKAGILALGRSLNEEIRLSGDDAISVATVLPWAAATPIWQHAANYTGRKPCMPAMDAAQEVVDAIVRIAQEPEEEVAVGWKAGGAVALHDVFPDTVERVSGDLAHEGLVERGAPTPDTSGALHAPMPDGTAVGLPVKPCPARPPD